MNTQSGQEPYGLAIKLVEISGPVSFNNSGIIDPEINSG